MTRGRPAAFAEADACRLVPPRPSPARATTTDVDAEHPQPRSRRTRCPARCPGPASRCCWAVASPCSWGWRGTSAARLARTGDHRAPARGPRAADASSALGTVIALERACTRAGPWLQRATGHRVRLPVAATAPAHRGRAGCPADRPLGAGRIYGALWRRADPRRSRSNGWAPPATGGCCCDHRRHHRCPVPLAGRLPRAHDRRRAPRAGPCGGTGPGAQAGLLGISAAVATAQRGPALADPGTEVFGPAPAGPRGVAAPRRGQSRTVRRWVSRYSAVNLLLGMAWLAVAGGSWVVLGPRSTAPATTWSSTR